MIKKDMENLLNLYRAKDKLNRELNATEWDDPFCGEPECHARSRQERVEKIKCICEAIRIMELTSKKTR